MALRKFQGRVVRYQPRRGFGFIKIDYPATGREAYFHLTECDFRVEEITVGDRLEFYLEDHVAGLQAIQVSRI